MGFFARGRTDPTQTFLIWREGRLWQEIHRVTDVAEAVDVEAEEADTA